MAGVIQSLRIMSRRATLERLVAGRIGNALYAFRGDRKSHTLRRGPMSRSFHNSAGLSGPAVLLAVVLLTGTGLAAWKSASIRKSNEASSHQPEPIEAVTTAVAVERQYRQSTTSIGTVLALRSITLSNELAGTVRRVNLTPGQVVEEGTVLVGLDVSVEEADLQAQQARAASPRPHSSASSGCSRLKPLRRKRWTRPVLRRMSRWRRWPVSRPSLPGRPSAHPSAPGSASRTCTPASIWRRAPSSRPCKVSRPRQTWISPWPKASRPPFTRVISLP
jgi:Membrane-fusion protein